MSEETMSKISIHRLRAILERDRKICTIREKHLSKLKSNSLKFKQAYPWALRELLKAEKMIKVSKKLVRLKNPGWNEKHRVKMIDMYVSSKLTTVGFLSLSLHV